MGKQRAHRKQAAATPHSETERLLTAVAEIEAALDTIVTDKDRHRVGQEIHSKLRRTAWDLAALEKRNDPDPAVPVIRVRLHEITVRVLADVFGFADDQADLIEGA